MFQCYISKWTGKIFPMHSESLQCDVHVKAFVTARKRSLRRLCFYTCLSVILFTGGGGSASVHAGIHPARSRDPQYMRSACSEIRTTSGRYASYWNAVFLDSTFSGSILFVCRGYIFCGFKGLTGLIGRSKGGARDAPLHPDVQILSISCSFWGNLAKSCVGAPLPPGWRPYLGEILDPPQVSICPRGGGGLPHCLLGYTPRTRSRLPWAETPHPPGRHPPWADFPWAGTPWADTPCTVLTGIWSTSGRYASNWNAFLSFNRFSA